MRQPYSQVVIAVLVSLASPGCLCAKQPRTAADYLRDAESKIRTVSCNEAKALLDAGGYLILDVRTPGEFEAGHLPGAVNLFRGALEFKIAEVISGERDRPILVYCRSGGRSALATQTLLEMGYSGAVNMAGGWLEWTEKGYAQED